LDGAALAGGVARQRQADNLAIARHGDCDVTGKLDWLERCSPSSTISDQDVAEFAVASLATVQPRLPGSFDIVASTCLLSQLISSAVVAMGDGHPKFAAVMQSLRAGHLRLMNNLLIPGGTGVLVTDIVSSDTCAELWKINEQSLRTKIVDL